MNNKNLAIILAVIAVAVLGFVGYKYTIGSKFDQGVVCEKCGTLETIKACATTKYPVNCKKCNTATAYVCIKMACLNDACPEKGKEVNVPEKGKEVKCAKCGMPLSPK